MKKKRGGLEEKSSKGKRGWSVYINSTAGLLKLDVPVRINDNNALVSFFKEFKVIYIFIFFAIFFFAKSLKTHSYIIKVH
jgi:hypothetical protein